MKNLFLSLLAASIAFTLACSGNVDETLDGESATTAKKTCAESGGTCVAVYPGACANGSIDSTLSCGGGVGTTCCLEDEEPDAAIDAGPPSCAAAGGTCVAVYPGACAGGTINASLSCGGIGASCCFYGAVDAGPAKDGGPKDGGPKKDSGVIDAGPPIDSGIEDGGSASDCVAAGGTCTAVYPGACKGVSVPSLSCGGGIGVSCCFDHPPPL